MTKEKFFYEETAKHIRNVQLIMNSMIKELLSRSRLHDCSKYDEMELEAFTEITPELAKSLYGSDEYKENLKKIKPALEQHYKVNPHHPEHYPQGIQGMNLLDLMEMLADWIAATTRNPNGDIVDSIEKNKQRFQYSEELESILKNTARKYVADIEIMEAHCKFEGCSK